MILIPDSVKTLRSCFSFLKSYLMVAVRHTARRQVLQTLKQTGGGG